MTAPRRTHYQRNRRPIRVTQNHCPDTGKLVGEPGRYRECTTCGRQLLRDVSHLPRHEGAYGWTEYYSDRSTYAVAPGDTPKAV